MLASTGPNGRREVLIVKEVWNSAFHTGLDVVNSYVILTVWGTKMI